MTIYGMNFGEKFVEKYRNSDTLPETINYEHGHWIEFHRNHLLDWRFIRKRLKGCVLDSRGRTLRVREYMDLPKIGTTMVVDGMLVERDGRYTTE